MSSAPTTVGPYEILGEIGRGGMGIVYRATDRRLGRDVAIKALPDQVAHDPDRLERFQREARSLAQINHPNIAGIFGVEEQDGRHYLVLEFVDGATLSERLDAGALPIEDTIQVGTQIASAIEAAHDAGIVHRDLKPDNIKVTPEGRIKVLDFGLAKTENTSAFSTGNTETASIRQDATAPGVILGTAAYMSPEQVRGRHIDKRTDLWAFGVIIYEMLTGIGPFRGDTATDSIGAVLHKEIDYDLLPKTTPAPLVRLIQRCLTRDREHRLRDAGDARLELEEALRAPAESPAHKHTSARSWWLPLAVCVLAVAAVGWRYWNTPATETPLVRSSLIAPEGMAMTRPKLSPDGQHIAAIGFPREYGQLGTPTIDSLLYRSLDEAEFKAAPIAGVEFFDFSPDSTSIAFAARGEEISETLRLYRMPADGSAAPTQIMSIPSEFRPSGRRWFSWLPSNEFVFLDKSAPRLVLYSADTGKQTRDIPISSDDPDLDLGSITGTFGDNHIAVSRLRYTDDGFAWDELAIDTTTGNSSLIIENADFSRLVDGNRLMFARGNAVYECEFDIGTMSITGTTRPIQSGLATAFTFDHGWYDLADNGTLVYVSGGLQANNRRLVVIEESGAETLLNTEPREYTQSIAVAPDGSRVAVIIPNPGGLFEIWGADTDNPRLRRIIAQPRSDFYEPLFTHDGEHIILARWSPAEDEPSALLMLPFDGQSQPKTLFGGWDRTSWVQPTTALPDGRHILIAEYARGANRMLLLDLESDDPPHELLTRSMIYTPRAAPTGDMIAFVTDDTGKPEVYVCTLDTDSGTLGVPVPMTNSGAWGCRWSIAEDGQLRVHHTDLNRREWITSVSLTGGRISFGETSLGARALHERIEEADMDDRGLIYAILKSESERPNTHVELVQGWLQSQR